MIVPLKFHTLGDNRPTRKERRNEWFREREAKDPAFKLGRRMAKAVRTSLQPRPSTRLLFAAQAKRKPASKGGGSWQALVGYSASDLRTHLERQFEKGMTWDNYGEWHIDHIVPLSRFEVTGPHCENFRAAWALSNLRPLWAAENLSKRASRRHLL